MDKSSGILEYKPIYKEGDAIKFTPLSAPGLAPADNSVKYSKTSVGVEYDENTYTVDGNGALKRKNYYSADAPIVLDSATSKLKVVVDDVTIGVNDAGKLTMKYSADAPMKYVVGSENV